MKRTGFRPPTHEQIQRAEQRKRASARRYQEKQRERRKRSPDVGKLRKPIPRENRERRSKRMEQAFGPQAEWCRHSPCVACRPELYGDDLLALEHHSPKRISDPHHTVARPAGKDRDTIPLCRKHHRACSAVNSSERMVQEACGRNFREVASIIRRELEGNQ